jgi:hypothetical protein
VKEKIRGYGFRVEIVYHWVKAENRSFRKGVSMEPPQYNGGLLGLQKREYLAKRKVGKGIRKYLNLIFKPYAFGS